MKMTTLIIAVALATLAAFAAEARAGGSFDEDAPIAVLMKYKTVLQRVGPSGGEWTYCSQPGLCGTSVYDNFGLFYFPKPDEVGAGRRLHVRFDKPERPSFFEVSVWPKVRKAKNCGRCTRPLGERRVLKSIVRPVKRNGKTTGWSVFFRTNEPQKDYYLRVAMGWKQKPGSHTSYGRIVYGLYVKTR